MKIFILTMDEPVYTNPFIKKIIKARKKDIVGVAVTDGSRLTIGPKRSKSVYLVSLLLIMGFPYFFRSVCISMGNKLKNRFSSTCRFYRSSAIIEYASQLGIATYWINAIDDVFIRKIEEIQPDIIINQSQNIIKKKLLDIPKMGVLNRHNALLPKNRGRLTPFWVLYHGEQETGVSIHFLTEGIDDGDIVVQERFEIDERDDIHAIVKKNYEIAPYAMLKALAVIEKGDFDVIANSDRHATYNTTPTFREALTFRLGRIIKWIHRQRCLFH